MEERKARVIYNKGEREEGRKREAMERRTDRRRKAERLES